MATSSAPASVQVRRVDFGWFIRPASETGTGSARAEPCLGYLVAHPGGTVLVDTGMGEHPDLDAHYRPRRIRLEVALAAVGVGVGQVDEVVNCHLHADHCGANPELTGRPIVVQRAELDAARHEVDHTLAELVDAPGLVYEVLDGEAEILPGLTVVPTPGHTAGHQSLVVRGADGTVLVAGQAVDRAGQWSAAALAWRAGEAGRVDGLPVPPAWMDLLDRFDPRRVVFAHDHAVWEP